MLNRNTLSKDIQDALNDILNKDLEDLKEEEFCFLSARRDYLNSREIETFLESKPITKKGKK